MSCRGPSCSTAFGQTYSLANQSRPVAWQAIYANKFGTDTAKNQTLHSGYNPMSMKTKSQDTKRQDLNGDQLNIRKAAQELHPDMVYSPQVREFAGKGPEPMPHDIVACSNQKDKGRLNWAWLTETFFHNFNFGRIHLTLITSPARVDQFI